MVGGELTLLAPEVVEEGAVVATVVEVVELLLDEFDLWLLMEVDGQEGTERGSG